MKIPRLKLVFLGAALASSLSFADNVKTGQRHILASQSIAQQNPFGPDPMLCRIVVYPAPIPGGGFTGGTETDLPFGPRESTPPSRLRKKLEIDESEILAQTSRAVPVSFPLVGPFILRCTAFVPFRPE